MLNRPSVRTLSNKHNLIGAEIGTSNGANARNILENLDIQTLYLIDPYIAYEHYLQYTVTRWQIEAIKQLNPYNDKIVWVEKKSHDARNMFQNQSLDFVYIDGAHDYHSIRKDIWVYARKIKHGGLLAGHDHDHIPVEVAVKAFFLSRKYIIDNLYIDVCVDTDTDWWMIIP